MRSDRSVIVRDRATIYVHRPRSATLDVLSNGNYRATPVTTLGDVRRSHLIDQARRTMSSIGQPHTGRPLDDLERDARADQCASTARSPRATSPSAWSSAAPPSTSTSSSTPSPRCWCSRSCSSRSSTRSTGTLYSFAIFALAFIARPFGTVIFMAIDRALRPRHQADDRAVPARHARPRHRLPAGLRRDRHRVRSCCWRCLRIGQGMALGGSWDGLPSLLALNAPPNRRGWYAMMPQLGAPLGF